MPFTSVPCIEHDRCAKQNTPSVKRRRAHPVACKKPGRNLSLLTTLCKHACDAVITAWTCDELLLTFTVAMLVGLGLIAPCCYELGAPVLKIMPHVFRETANTRIWMALPLLLLALIPVSVYLYSAAPAICRLPSFCKDRRLRSHLPGSIFCAAVRRMALLLHESQVLKICWFCAHITQMLLLPCSHWACSSAPGVLEQVSEFISFMARRPWLATLLPWMFLASTHCLRFFGRLLDWRPGLVPRFGVHTDCLTRAIATCMLVSACQRPASHFSFLRPVSVVSVYALCAQATGKIMIDSRCCLMCFTALLCIKRQVHCSQDIYCRLFSASVVLYICRKMQATELQSNCTACLAAFSPSYPVADECYFCGNLRITGMIISQVLPRSRKCKMDHSKL